MTNVFELPLQQWGACSHPGHGGGWFGGLPSELREDHLPNHPMGHLHCCCQARAFAFIQLSALNINKQWGLTFPSTSTPTAIASGKPTSARVPAGTSPCFPCAPRAGVQCWCISSHSFPFLLSPCPPQGTQPLSIKGPALQSRLRGWGSSSCPGCPGAPPGTLPSSPICQALDNTVTGPEMGKE